MALSKEDKVAIFEDLASLTHGTSTSLSTVSIDTSSTVQVAAEVTCTYGSAQVTGARLDVFGSLDGTNYSTQPFASYYLTMPGYSTTVTQTFGIASAPRYLKFKVTNPDSVATNADFTHISLYVQRQTVS